MTDPRAELAALERRLEEIDAELSVGSRAYLEEAVVEADDGTPVALDDGPEELHVERQAVVEAMDEVRAAIAAADRAALEERRLGRG